MYNRMEFRAATRAVRCRTWTKWWTTSYVQSTKGGLPDSGVKIIAKNTYHKKTTSYKLSQTIPDIITVGSRQNRVVDSSGLGHRLVVGCCK